MSRRSSILLVEDDPSLRMLTAAVLRREFDVIPASTAAQAQGLLVSESVDMVLLDLGLPDEDGLVLARQIRSRSSRPAIVFLTSRDSIVDKVNALNLGGDDYVTKPFDPEELSSRIRAVLRRTSSELGEPAAPKRVKVGYVEVDLETREVWTASGELALLTRAEFDVFLALVNANGRILSRSVLLDAISNSPDHDASGRLIDALISRIRRKLSSEKAGEKIILTVQGLGYRLGVARS